MRTHTTWDTYESACAHCRGIIGKSTHKTGEIMSMLRDPQYAMIVSFPVFSLPTDACGKFRILKIAFLPKSASHTHRLPCKNTMHWSVCDHSQRPDTRTLRSTCCMYNSASCWIFQCGCVYSQEFWFRELFSTQCWCGKRLALICDPSATRISIFTSQVSTMTR